MSIRDVIETAEYALGPRAFEALYRGALQLPTREMRIKTITVLVLAGRLAFRVKTCQHIREAWINWERGEIRVPPMDPCDCYRCWLESYWAWLGRGLRQIGEMDDDKQPDWYEPDKRAKAYSKEARERIPEVADLDSDELVELLCETKHDPKTPSGGRVIAFGWSPRITTILLTFFREYDCIEETQQTIRNWVERAAENAGIPTEDWKLHGLRSDSISFLLRLTGDPITTMELVGLQDFQSFNNYHSQYDVLTTSLLYRAAGRSDWAPARVPEYPDEKYPVALGSHAIDGELRVFGSGVIGDPKAREQRVQKNEDREFPLYHPRGDLHDSRPDGYAGFPDTTDLEYDRYEDHEVPIMLSDDARDDDDNTITTPTLEEAVALRTPPEFDTDESQRTLSEGWEHDRVMVPPIPTGVLQQLSESERVSEIIDNRIEEVKCGLATIRRSITPNEHGLDPQRAKTAAAWWVLIVVSMAIGFAQTNIHTNETSQLIFASGLVSSLMLFPWTHEDLQIG